MDTIEYKYTVSGRGVYAVHNIPIGLYILHFVGDECTSAEIDASVEDKYLQIGTNLFMGPSNDFDDYTNHSCDPNCGIEEGHDGLYRLKAIKSIGTGEEITWDYSTYNCGDSWQICECKCGTSKCRGKVRTYKDIPRTQMEQYMRYGVVPSFVILDMICGTN